MVDGAWWKRHAHLVSFADRGLAFEPGSPLPESPPKSSESSTPPAPAGEAALSGLVGQDALVARLTAAAKGSEARKRPFPHTLLSGPAGTGKTTLARCIAAAIGGRLVKACGPMLDSVVVLLRLLAGLSERDVLFLEEVHAMPRPVIELLYEAMAERSLTLTLHCGPSAKSVRLDLPPFTVVAATTEEGTLPEPFKSRFVLRESLALYRREDLAVIATRATGAEGIDLEPEAADLLAGHARGTPRETLRLLDRVLDDAAIHGIDRVGRSAVAQVLAGLGYEDGLTPLERRCLEAVRESRRPIALDRLARLLGVSASTILVEAEPELFRRGLLQTTPLGRAAVA